MLAIELVVGGMVVAMSNKVAMRRAAETDPVKSGKTLTLYARFEQSGFRGKQSISLLRNVASTAIQDRERKKDVITSRVIQLAIGDLLFLTLTFCSI